MSDIVKLIPAKERTPDNGARVEDLSRAFLNLEPDICDLRSVCRILMLTFEHEPDVANTAAELLEEKIEAFRERYYELHRGRDTEGDEDDEDEE